MSRLRDVVREEWWAAWWYFARLVFGLHSPQAKWCEDRWAKSWWRQRDEKKP